MQSPDQPPAERIRLNLMLADGAEVHVGKLFIMGGAVNNRPPNVGGLLAIAGTVTVPWDQTNQKHQLSVALVTPDRQPIKVPTPLGEQPFVIGVSFEVGRPPGVPRGISLAMPFAVQFALPGLPEGSYDFRFSIDGVEHSDATLRLFVMPAQASA